MSDKPSIITPEARAWADRDYGVQTVTISVTDIARFAHATGERDAVHFDPKAARQAGYPDVLAPPMFCVALRIGTFTLRPISEYEPDGWPSEDIPPLPTKRGMAGETQLVRHDDLFAGDEVSVRKELLDMREKQARSGPLVLMDFEYTYTTSRGLAAVERFTRILR